ncbi:Conserved_hypothetical protein [Hexamita inflata]|uniref:VPS9 domain-containing protein n=1 Tax=Hexamita inflata TaxID=28002 RepID=A0AA86U903_9EUKA|nr:Conserved hypothetical protein [Hexamita inflata]
MPEIDELSNHLLKILLPYPVIMQVDQVKGSSSMSDATVRFTHSMVSFSQDTFTAKVKYGDIYSVSILDKENVILRVYQYMIPDSVYQIDISQKSIQDVNIKTQNAPLFVNTIQYRVNIYRLWTRRLQSGVIKTALRYPLTLTQLNQNRTLFGQVSAETLVQISDCVKEFGFSKNRMNFSLFKGDFVPIETKFDSSLQNWSNSWPWSKNSSQQSSDYSQQQYSEYSQISALERRRSDRSSSMGNQSIGGSLMQEFETQIAMSNQNAMGTMLTDVLTTRDKLKRFTGQTEQTRLKTVIDYCFLNSKKIFKVYKDLVSEVLSKKNMSFGDTAMLIRDQIERIKNTLVKEYCDDISKFQVIRELAIESIEALDPVQIDDLASISVEEAVFGSIFANIFKKCKDERAVEDQDFFFKCEQMNESADLYDLLEIPMKHRDPCDYQLAVNELQQLDSAVNFHPRHFLNCLVETVFAIQLTVRFSTPCGLQATSPEQVTLAADDLIPILSFVFVKARLQNAITVYQLCDQLIDERIRNDEYGNVLIHFCMVVETIKQVEIQM